MICSRVSWVFLILLLPKEFADGIQILPEEAVPGEEVFSYLDLDDEIIELSITPNRADALSIRGVAHEGLRFMISQYSSKFSAGGKWKSRQLTAFQ